METLIIFLALLAGVIGIVGSVVPGIPGPPVGWCGVLVLYLWGDGALFGAEPITLVSVLIWGVVMAAVTVLDFVVPSWLTKVTGGSRYGSRGALIGLFAGMILTPIGMMAGAFLGAWLGEAIYAQKKESEALKSAFGAFLGIMLGTGLKLIVTVSMMAVIIYHL